MDKENDENLAREELSRIPSADPEQGNSRGFSPITALESEPARSLQLSQSFFVADTCEDDDESMMIPPTQDFLIPSTPPPAETSKKEENSSHNDTTISNLDETCIEDAEKTTALEDNNDSENDMTQDLPELDETQQILVVKTAAGSSSKELEKETQGDDDDWNLKFSETQETQELLGSARMRESLEKEESARLPVIEENAEMPTQDLNINRPTDSPKLDQPTPTKTPEIATVEEEESDDEIEPSQSCLADFPRDTYSAYRDQLSQLAMEPPTAHSTPDNTFNGGSKDPKTNTEPDKTVVPSPIVNPGGATAPYELKESAEEKLCSESTMIIGTEPPAEPEKESRKEEISKVAESECPVLVLDTQSGDLVKEMKEVEDGEKKVEFVVDTIELMSSVEESEVPKEKEVVVKEPEVEAMEVSCKEDVKDSKEIMNFSEEPEHNASELSSGDDSSTYVKNDIPSIETLPETLPTIMLPPPPPTISRLSRKQTFEKNKKSGLPASQKKSSIGTFQDSKSLDKIFNNYGISIDHEGTEAILSLRPNEEIKVKKKLEFTIKDNRVFLDESFEVCRPHYTVSPHSSLHSGEMADISSSSSAKSANFSSVHSDTSSALSSQENKTSTQNSEKNSFSNVLWAGKKDDEKALSPIKAEEEKTRSPVSAARSKRGGGRKAAAKPNNKAAAPAPKRKRGRAAAKSKAEEAPKTEEIAPTVETDLESSANVRPRKARKKNGDEPSPVEVNAGTSFDAQAIAVFESSSGDAYADSPYGSILPGIRVMARWKDGYYYPGEVVSQEMEGRWSIRFDDSDIRVIPQENLIKVAILERGTSVFAKSPDDFYDPGIVCGHFREGSSVGYEVELDDGVTKRYPRTSVILSTDQAKLLISTRPSTTPSTETINLDNIINGKRKRKSKSLQSPDPNPVAKKSPRITRMRNIDPNVDTTADERDTNSKRKTHTTETEEESTSKQRNTRKRKAAKAGATKITQISKQGAAKTPKLFKDYAFLLTNADRKPTNKSYNSDTADEDEEVVPFDKDELVNLILSRGGQIIETFEDLQKCKRKNIYLLANTYLRTMKYIKCIAAGIPCIKHSWVQNCCYKGEILNLESYRLPSGKSLITNLIVEWHGKNDVLKGVKISLISSAENPFVHTWAPVLLAAKADFVQKWNLPSSKLGACIYVDVLVTNPYCPSDVLSSAKRRKIPIVSSEWIIQSLIAGKRLPYDAHPKFKHDFTE